MTPTHLPECRSRGCTCAPDDYGHLPDCSTLECICEQLRACENRVRAEISSKLHSNAESYAAGYRDAAIEHHNSPAPAP